jgi:hypothetical protein
MATVTEVLTAATDSVTVINDINTNGSSSNFWLPSDTPQAEINEMVQRNVDHLGFILAYDGSNPEQPDIVNSPEDKSSYTDAITTGNAYIAAN